MSYLGKRPQDTFPATNAITTTTIADNAVTSVKIAENNITTRELAANTIATGNIADNAVDGTKIAQNSILTRHIDDSQIATSLIADDAVTLAKMDGLARGKIIYGDSSGDPAALAVGSANYILTSDGTDISWAAAGNATTFTASANNSTDETVYPVFVDGATGTQGAETDTGLTYNPSSGLLTTTLLAGTLNTAAQGNVTSLGTLTALTVDDVAINGKVVTMTGSSGDTATVTVGTNGTLDITTVDTAAAAANMTLTADGTFEAVGTTVTLDSGGAINLEPASGSAILLDGTISVDAGVVTGATSITSTAFVGDITGDVTGNADTATTATTATNVTASANNSTDETVYPTFVDGATGGQGIETDTGLTYNPSSGLLTIAGELDAGSLDISGNADVDGTMEADAYTVDGTTLAEYIADTTGAMFSSNTESGITVTYQDGDNTVDLAVDAAQTGITSLLATDIKIGEDDQTKIDFETADTINFYAGNEKQLILTDGALTPGADNILDLGSSGVEFKDGFFDGTVTADAFAGPLTGDVTGTSSTVTVSDSTANTNFPVVFHDESNALLDDTGALRYNPSTGELLVPNLTVAGTTTQVDTVTMNAQNAVIFEGATADGNETTLSVVDPTGDHTQYLINQGGYIPVLAAATTTAISSTPAELNLLDTAAANTVVNSKAVIYGSSGELAGTLSTAAQTNVTSLGTLTALTVDDVAINGKVVTMTGSSSDTAVFTAGTNGTLSIVTTDAAAAAANIQITADGTVDIDSAGVLTLDSGAAINIEPAAGSAILLDGTISIDAGVVTGATAITLSGELDAGSLDVSGDADIDGTLEADAITVDGTALNEYIADTVGAMVGSNTESGITVAYQDGDNTLDFTVGTLNQDTSGTAAIATTVTITDNESTDEDNAIIFTAGGDVDGGNLGLESDGTLTYNPSSGLVTATSFAGQVTTAAQTNITSLLATDIKIGEDDQTKIDFETADEIHFYAANVEQVYLGDNIFGPQSDSDVDFGSTGVRWKDAFVDSITVTGEVDGASLDISGNADIDGTLEADAYTVDGTALNEYIADTVGAMVGSNTESGITVAYQDGDNTLDFTVGTLNQDTTGTAAIATTVTITDNESTNENNAIIFTAGGDLDGGNLGLESDGDLHYNPSTGLVTATGFSGNLTGTLQTASQTNITSVGTIGTGVWQGTAIASAYIANNAILTQHIDDNQVTTDQIAANTIATANIADNAVDGTKIAQNSILTRHIDDGQVDTAQLAADAVDGTKIADDAIDSEHYADGSIDNAHIADDAIDSEHYATGSIDAAHIANNAILTQHIDDNQVTTDQIAANTIATANIADNAVDGTKIASNSILTRHIDDDQVTGDQLADAITVVTSATTPIVIATTSARITQVAITSSSNATAWDSTAAANAYYVTSENTTFAAPSNATEGAIISVEIAQGGTARTVAWNTVFEFAASTAPTVTATASKTDIFTFRYNGSVWQEIGRVQNMAQT